MVDELCDGIDRGDDCAFGFESSGVAPFAATEVEDGFAVEFGEDGFQSGIEDDAAGVIARFALMGNPVLGRVLPHFERSGGDIRGHGVVSF